MSNDSSSTDIDVKRQKSSWGPAASVFVTALAFLGAQLIAGGLFMAVLAIGGASSGRINGLLASTFGQFIVVVVSEILTLLILWLFLRYRKIDWRILGFKRKAAWKDIGYAVIGFLIYLSMLMIAIVLAKVLFHIDVNKKQEIGFSNVASSMQRLATFISLVLLPPIAEETLFRGFMFGGFRKKLPFIWAALFTSFLFALPHLFEANAGLLWTGAIDTFILSLVLCYLREKTGALWASFSVHMLKNGLAFMALYVFASK